MKKKLLILFSFFVVVLATGFILNFKYYHKNELDTQSILEKITAPTPTATPALTPSQTPEPTPKASALPSSYLIKNFPFQSQAPDANWDQLHDEACEEAALILVKFYLDGKTLSAEIMESEIQKMVAWEIENFGSHKDLTIAEVAQMAKKYYSIDGQIKNDITIDNIKKEIASGHPVIIPTAGRLLGNPYFRSPGPIYHMVVAIGYEGNTIIVQDVGTKRGDHYKYSEKVLYNAIHDWAGGAENIENGAKNILVFDL